MNNSYIMYKVVHVPVKVPNSSTTARPPKSYTHIVTKELATFNFCNFQLSNTPTALTSAAMMLKALMAMLLSYTERADFNRSGRGTHPFSPFLSLSLSLPPISRFSLSLCLRDSP